MIKLFKNQVQRVTGFIISILRLDAYFKTSFAYHRPRGRLKTFLYNSSVFYRFYCEEDYEKREYFKASKMGGESGRWWAKSYSLQPINLNEKIGYLNYEQACPLLPFLNQRLKEMPHPVQVIQIGSSSGREIAWLAQRHPRHSFTGTDIYPEVVKFSEQQHQLANLAFKLYAAETIVELLRKYPASQNKIVISSGSLQYVHPDQLKLFFGSVGQLEHIEIVLLEPADKLNVSPLELRKSLPRGNFSFTHNYRQFAEAAGFVTEKIALIEPYSLGGDDFLRSKHITHYFYWCKRKGQRL